jgi:nucleoside-diphosphate-sugar epimerase
MTVLVTGGTGFVGAYVVRRLVERGERVVCYDLAPHTALLADLFGGSVPDEVSVVRGDVTDAHFLARTLKKHGVDRIAHLAVLLGAPAERNVPAAVQVNAVGTLNVFEAAALLDVRKVAWTSSIGVYGPRSLNPDGRIDDDSLPDPRSAYGATKTLCEHLARLYDRRIADGITGVRFSTVYGWGKQLIPGRDTALGWLPELIDKPAGGVPGLVPGGAGGFDFQYVEDAARALLAALDAPGTAGRTYVTHGDQRPVRAAYDHVRSVLPGAALEYSGELGAMVFGGDGSGTRLIFGDRVTAADRLYEAKRCEQEIGYAPEWSMERGISATIDAIRAAPPG